MTFSKWPWVKITCQPKLLCKCLTSKLNSSVLKIYFTLHGMEWSRQALGRTRDITFLGESRLWHWHICQVLLREWWWDNLCSSLDKFFFTFKWADFVDPILPFNETHAQNESGKTGENARNYDCNPRMAYMAWKDQLLVQRESPGKGSCNSFPSYHLGSPEQITHPYGLCCSESLWLRKSEVELLL